MLLLIGKVSFFLISVFMIEWELIIFVLLLVDEVI